MFHISQGNCPLSAQWLTNSLLSVVPYLSIRIIPSAFFLWSAEMLHEIHSTDAFFKSSFKQQDTRDETNLGATIAQAQLNYLRKCNLMDWLCWPKQQEGFGPCFNKYLNNSICEGLSSIYPFLKRRGQQQNNMVFTVFLSFCCRSQQRQKHKYDLYNKGITVLNSSSANVLWQRRGQRVWLMV